MDGVRREGRAQQRWRVAVWRAGGAVGLWGPFPPGKTVFLAEGNVWLTIMVAGGIHEAMDLRVGSPESTMFLGFVAYFESLMRSQ